MTRLVGHGTTRTATVAAAVAALTLLTIPATAAAKCHAGVHNLGSAEARTFCGKAKATITLPGRKVTLQGGSCERTSGHFTINIGTVVLSSTANHPPHYFGLTVGKPVGSQPAGQDGTYIDDAAIAFVFAHRRYAVLQSTVSLNGGRSYGSFTGTLLSGAAVSGTFHC